MKHLGHILVAFYSLAALVLQYFPAMASSQGISQSGPWLLAMVVALLFAIGAGFKLFRNVLESWSSDDVSMSEFDVPDHILFGFFTAFVGINLIAHGVLAALADVAGSIWFGTWVMADLIVTLISFVVFKVTAKQALKKANSSVRSFGGRDAA